ncbi:MULTISPECIES: hypothetical protein [unclassified Pseudomonas]|nr:MULTISPECIES: hypothetical protein [unclassified Pseudomonas]
MMSRRWQAEPRSDEYATKKFREANPKTYRVFVKALAEAADFV